MPKTNAERAAHLIQAYIDSDNGKNANADVQYVQTMRTSLEEKFQKLENEDRRAPMPFMSMKTRYRELDEKLKETADYIKAGNVDPKELEQKQDRIINLIGGLRSDHRDVRDVLADPDNDDHELYQELFAGYDNKKLDEMEVGKAQNVLRTTGESKSAYKWIDSVYEDMKTPKDVTEENVARILAARQLGNAVYDHPDNIKKAKISQSALNNHAQKLMASKEFKDYYETVKNLDFKKTIKHGHGGYLEKTFEDFLVNTGAKGPLEFDAHGRYQKVLDAKSRDISQSYDYKSYADYFEKNKGKVITSKEVLAARMAAADDLARKNPNAPFDKTELDKRAREFLGNPAFKLMATKPDKMDLIINGDASGFAASVKEMNDACKSMLDENGEFRCTGFPEIAMDRLEKRVKENKDLEPVVKSVKALKQGKKEPKDIVNTLSKIMEYQGKHMKDGSGPMGKDMNDTLRVLHELTVGTPLNSIVQTQIDKTNQTRGVDKTYGSFVTKDLIAKEGKEKLADFERRLGLNTEFNDGMDLGHVSGPLF